jgi:Protein of unknown function (DUF2971)
MVLGTTGSLQARNHADLQSGGFPGSGQGGISGELGCLEGVGANGRIAVADVSDTSKSRIVRQAAPLRVRQRRGETPMPSIFHYTNSAGLLGILQSRCLFATDYRYLNDLSEGTMIRDHICAIFEAEIGEIAPKLVESGLLDKLLYEHHGAGVHRQQAEGTYKAIVRALDKTSPIFVLSFCRHTEANTEQHGLLSQWRAYAGSGFAIEFDDLKLDRLLKAEYLAYGYPIMKSGDVRYRGYEEMLDPDVYRGVAGELIRTGFEPTRRGDVTEITGRKELDDVMFKFAATAFFLKHHGFAEEQEYRIIGGSVRKDKIRKGAKVKEKEILFRQRDGLIVPYIELFKKSKHPLPIKSIIVGPHPFQEKQATAVLMALQSTPFSKAEVKLSKIPLKGRVLGFE